jgi:hypothetical protein
VRSVADDEFTTNEMLWGIASTQASKAVLSGPWGTVAPLPSATRAQAALMDELAESWKAKPPKVKTEA